MEIDYFRCFFFYFEKYRCSEYVNGKLKFVYDLTLYNSMLYPVYCVVIENVKSITFCSSTMYKCTRLLNRVFAALIDLPICKLFGRDYPFTLEKEVTIHRLNANRVP